jgi:DNA-binding beta-propeller fold protein YncE
LIVEYLGGLSASNCKGTVLGVTLKFPGGMVLDNRENIYICDQLAPNVYLVKYPYNGVTKQLGSGWQEPFHVTFSHALNRIYVADFGAAVVKVIAVPSDKHVATLGASEGLSLPSGAVDGENFAL